MNLTGNFSKITNISFIRYAENPYPNDVPKNALQKFIDIDIEDSESVNWPIYIRLYYTQDDLNNSNITKDQLLGLYYYNTSENKWLIYNDTGVNTTYNNSYEGYVWANIWHLTPLVSGGDSEPPSKVEGLSVSDAKDGKLDLSWDAATDNVEVAFYNIYWGENNYSEPIANVTHPTTKYQHTDLVNGQEYCYKVSAVDTSRNEGEKSNEECATPTKTPSPPDPEPDPGPGTSPSPPPAGGADYGVTLTKPVADAGGPYFEFKGLPVVFDGSDSTGSDGTIESHEWIFGDGNFGSGMIVSHIYDEPGNYTVTLTVTNDDGGSDTDTTFALIAPAPNYPPSVPVIKGKTVLTVNKNYTFSAYSYDVDNDSMKYNFSWGDNSFNETAFVPNGTIVELVHSWDNAGIYDITVMVTDENNATNYGRLIVYVDVIEFLECDDFTGYLLDTDADGIYDLFFNNQTGIETLVELENGLYKIDVNGDGSWDYSYDSSFKSLNEIKEETQENYDILYYAAGIIIVILVFLIFAVILFKKAGREKNKKDTMQKDADKKMEKTKDRHLDYEEREKLIDELEERFK